MAVLMATGHSINLPTSVFDSVRALTATIAAELGKTAVRIGSLPGTVHHRDLPVRRDFYRSTSAPTLVVRGVRKG